MLLPVGTRLLETMRREREGSFLPGSELGSKGASSTWDLGVEAVAFHSGFGGIMTMCDTQSCPREAKTRTSS